MASKITLPILRRVAKNLLANHAEQITQVLSASPNFNTAPVESAFLVFSHSDAEPDIRDLPGFKHVSEYGSRKPVHPMEVGSCERFRFIISPELASYADAATSTTASTNNLYSTTGTNPDVYPFIVCGEDAWVQVTLRGKESFGVTNIPTGQKSGTDPFGQRGYIGAIGWFVCKITNQGWMAVVEAAVTNV